MEINPGVEQVRGHAYESSEEAENCSGFEGDEEIEMIYLHCDKVTQASLTCEALVCIPEPGWINVLNPRTRQLRRFPCSPDHSLSAFCLYRQLIASIIINPPWESSWFTVVTVSKLGILVLYDNHKRLFKYNTKTNEICCLSSDISVISHCLENLAPLRSDSRHHPEDYKIRTSSCGL
ncbi:unnamed protein product [Arabidopsis thaliana]|uniref:Uncharacterized protein n=1 Tax=Arabidopsis thaliana TaxID=3702 RepID=A0A5S9X6N0_ARATH|nr:unnamed protein product [Arabidopsis thaliana]